MSQSSKLVRYTIRTISGRRLGICFARVVDMEFLEVPSLPPGRYEFWFTQEGDQLVEEHLGKGWWRERGVSRKTREEPREVAYRDKWQVALRKS
jgi:hypothetical protein